MRYPDMFPVEEWAAAAMVARASFAGGIGVRQHQPLHRAARDLLAGTQRRVLVTYANSPPRRDGATAERLHDHNGAVHSGVVTGSPAGGKRTAGPLSAPHGRPGVRAGRRARSRRCV
jgi:hypothetical protein